MYLTKRGISQQTVTFRGKETPQPRARVTTAHLGLPTLPLVPEPRVGAWGPQPRFNRCTASHSRFAQGCAPAMKNHSHRESQGRTTAAPSGPVKTPFTLGAHAGVVTACRPEATHWAAPGCPSVLPDGQLCCPDGQRSAYSKHLQSISASLVSKSYFCYNSRGMCLLASQCSEPEGGAARQPVH